MNCVDKVAMKIAKLSWLHIPGHTLMPRIDFVAVVGCPSIRIPIKAVACSVDLFGKIDTFSNCHRYVCLAIIHVELK